MRTPEEIVDDLIWQHCAHDPTYTKRGCRRCVAIAISAAQREARREALQEATVTVVDYETEQGSALITGDVPTRIAAGTRIKTCKDILDRLRALAAGTGDGE